MDDPTQVIETRYLCYTFSVRKCLITDFFGMKSTLHKIDLRVSIRFQIRE